MATYVNLSKEDRNALYTVDELFSYFDRFHRGATLKSSYGDITPEEMRTAAKVIDTFLRGGNSIEVK